MRPARGATGLRRYRRRNKAISIHAPREGRDVGVIKPVFASLIISIHAPREGRDSGFNLSIGGKDNFNPRAPRGARRWRPSRRPLRATYFNPRAPCGARQIEAANINAKTQISIHAPHAGRDSTQSAPSISMGTFQSTRPMRGATLLLRPFIGLLLFQSTRPMRGATFAVVRLCEPVLISIHAPHAGRDGLYYKPDCGSKEFQSTRPMRGATSAYSLPLLYCHDFNPRAPCGARPCCVRDRFQNIFISIHAPHAGRDRRPQTSRWQKAAFQSTRPMRGATGLKFSDGTYADISIHAPHAGRDTRTS